MNPGEQASRLRWRAASKADQLADSHQQACDSSSRFVAPVGGKEGHCYRNVKVLNMFHDGVAIVDVHRSIPSRLEPIAAFRNKCKERSFREARPLKLR
jgi:hypothetical protein